jgi:hypothetical protein
MGYTLHNRFEREDFRGGRNILASEHLQYVAGGATLDAEVFGAGYIELGTLIARNVTTGKYEPVAAKTDLTGYDKPAVLNVDADCDGINDIIVGEVIIRGSVYEAKLPETVPAFFKAAVPMIIFENEK